MFGGIVYALSGRTYASMMISLGRNLKEWSGRWDSNPRLDLGKVPYYPYTTTALKHENSTTSPVRRQDPIDFHKVILHAFAEARRWSTQLCTAKPVLYYFS
jgi:hypothetical protein